MTSNPINPPLPADLPTNWTFNQIVAPNGSEVGMAEQYGYNYLMQQVNAAQRGVNSLGKGMEDLLPWSLASNENLLINWYFADPINQRNLEETSAAGYFVDRWRTNSVNVKLTLGDGCIVATTLNNITVATWALIQNIESPEKLIGTQLTLSLLVEEVVGKWSAFARFSTKSGSYIAGPTSAILKTGITTCTFVVPPNTGDLRAGAISMIQGAGQYIKIRAAKLELGDHQTLAHQDANGNWVLNDPPPDKALELAKCQRYYISFNEGIYPSGYITGSALEYYANLSLPVPLRAYPSLVGTPAFTVRLPTGGYSSRFPIGTATADSYRLGGYAANCISLVGIINAAVDPNNIPISLKVMPFALDAELY